jgi:tetratricopeptide (TPR) repeat protein
MRIQSHVSSDGSFTFRNVPTGRYTLRVSTFHGATIFEQFVDLHNDGQLTVRLPENRQSRPVSGLVSVRQLQRPVPEKAIRAFTQAQRESGKGRPLEATRKLDEALRLYPDYLEARCNLGVQYIRVGRPDEALEQFEKAIAIGPPSAMVYGNVAYIHLTAGRMAEAEEAARRAIALDSKLPQPHYLLGCVLAKSNRDSEAIEHLQLGAQVTPRVHILTARLYQKSGDVAKAAEELRLYLNSSDTAHRDDAQRWLKALTRN